MEIVFVLIFVWIIGCLFTIGMNNFVETMASIRTNGRYSKQNQIVMLILMLFIWPYFAGYILADLIDAMRKKD